MRKGTEHLFVAPADPDGALAIAALRRRFGPHDFQFLRESEVARRLAGLATEPNPSAPWIVDLVPSDSVDTLLMPALAALERAGARASWVYGRRQQPPVAIEALRDHAELVVEPGTPSWQLLCRQGDDDFCELGAEIRDRSTERGSAWATVLDALASSWDWSRLYGSVLSLARLETPDEQTLQWARSHLETVYGVRAAVRDAPVKAVDGVRVAIAPDPLAGARVRAEALRDVRTDVDAVIVCAGPGRMSIVTSSPSAANALYGSFSGVATATPGLVIDLAWSPGRTPPEIRAVLGDEACAAAAEAPPAGQAGRIEHPAAARIAKGIDPGAIPEADRPVIAKGLDGAV